MTNCPKAAQFDLLGAQRRVWLSNLKSLEKLVALAVLDHWSVDSPYPFPSIDQLGEWATLERCSVMRALTGLLQRGALLAGHIRGGHFVPTHRSGQSRAYDVRPLMSLPPAQQKRSRRATGRAEQPVAQSNTTGCPEQPQPVAESNPKEPRKEPRKEPTLSASANPATTDGTEGGKPAHVVAFEASFAQHDPEDVARFHIWQARFGKLGAKLDNRRAQLLEERRREGMTRSDFDAVLEGAAVDDWCRGTGYKLEAVLGSNSRGTFERFLENGLAIKAGTYRPPAKRGTPEPIQPRSGWQPQKTAFR